MDRRDFVKAGAAVALGGVPMGAARPVRAAAPSAGAALEGASVMSSG